MTSNNAYKLVQLSDCHLGRDTAYEQSGINTFESLMAVLADIKGVADHVVVSGDISCHGYRDSYELFAKAMGLQKYSFLPGNHDDLVAMNSTLPKPFQSKLAVVGWNLLMVNSSAFNRVEGAISDQELAQLERHLVDDNHSPTLVFMHHPPVDVGCAWLDRQKVCNAKQLFDLLSRYSNVKGIFCGHVHQSQFIAGAVPVYSSPSSCFQFLENSNDYAISDHPPGFRWIDLYADGSFKTGVQWAKSFSQIPDQHCVGY